MRLHPAEQALYDKLSALPSLRRDRLVSAVGRAARRRRFFYRDEADHPVGLIPMVLDGRTLAVLRRLTRALFRFQLRTPELHRANRKNLADIVRLERRTQAWFDKAYRPCRAWEHLMRPDFTLLPGDGGPVPRLFELNSLMLGGLYIQAVALSIMEGCILPRVGARTGRLGLTPSPDLLRFLERWLLEARRRSGGGRGGIAFLEQLPPGGGFSELPQITEHFQRRGTRSAHGDPRELVEKDGRVLLRGMPVSYAYRDFSFEDVGGPDNPRLAPFLKLWREGRVAPGFAADFDQKGILECLTSEAFSHLFTREEARLFAAHIPWTRVIAERRTTAPDGRWVDLPEHVLRAKDELVLKPSWSSGGEGILIGRKARGRRWRRVLDRALARPGSYAVQSFVDNPPRPCIFLRNGRILFKDCHFTIGMFHDGTRFGAHLRVSPKDIVNVAQGGALAPLYFARAKPRYRV